MKGSAVFFIFVLLSLVACSSTSSSSVVLDDGTVVYTCGHNYDDNYDFSYVGDIIRYQQQMFGETIYIYEFTLPTGEKVHLSESQLDNYNCF